MGSLLRRDLGGDRVTEIHCPLSCPDNRDGICGCEVVVLSMSGVCQRYMDLMRPELDAQNRRRLEQFRQQRRLGDAAT